MKDDETPRLPQRYSAKTLERNLKALERTQPELAARVRLPVDGAHVCFEPAPTYKLDRSVFPLALERDALDRALEPAADYDGPGPLVVFGFGLGEIVERLLQTHAGTRVVAWERDPWLLRLYLMRRDRARAIRSRQLTFALGVDVLDLPQASFVVEHPLLAQVYAREHAALRAGVRDKRALLCAGGLFVNQLGDALENAGYSVLSLDVERLAREELDHTIERFEPELIAAINYVNGLAEISHEHGVRLLCWEIDPTTTVPRVDRAAAESAHVFTYRSRDVDLLRGVGFPNVRHVPLAADPEVRSQRELTSAQREKYGARVSFVGSSLVQNHESFRRRFLEAYCLWRASGGSADAVDATAHAAEGLTLLQEVLVAQRAQLDRYLVPDLLEQRAPGFVDSFAGHVTLPDPSVLLGEIAASEKRLSYAASLAELGLVVWGDAGWEHVRQFGVDYRGPALHKSELTLIYNATTINVDIGRIFQSDIVTMRTFDILACGGFLLVEHSDELDDLFDVGTEVESYRTFAELKQKVVHYLAHEDEARAIAERGRSAVRERHTIERRLTAMLGEMTWHAA